MKSAIKDIFHGFRGHMDTMQMPKEHFEVTGKKLCKISDEVKEKFSPESLKLHQKFVDMLQESNLEEIEFYFAEGFKLGLLIGLECIEN